MSRVRPAIWIGLLAIAGALLAFAPPDQHAPVPRVVAALPRQPSPSSTPSNGPPDVLRLAARVREPLAEDALLWTDGSPPQPQQPARPSSPPAPQPVIAPAAPPLPFRVIGLYADGPGEGVVLLSSDGVVWLAQVGATIGTDYRVDTLAGSHMVLTYLPLNEQQTMNVSLSK